MKVNNLNPRYKFKRIDFELDPFSKLFLPNSEFMKQLETHRIKSDVKPRKVNIMQMQDNAIGVM